MMYSLNGSLTVALETATTEYTDVSLPEDPGKVYEVTGFEFWLYPEDPGIVAMGLMAGSIAINQRTTLGVGIMYADDIVFRDGIYTFNNDAGTSGGAGAYSRIFDAPHVEPFGNFFQGGDLRIMARVLAPNGESSGSFQFHYRMLYEAKKMTGAIRDEMLQRRYSPTA